LQGRVVDFQADAATTLTKLREKAREAVEGDGAEVVILGCTMQFGFYVELQEHLGGTRRRSGCFLL